MSWTLLLSGKTISRSIDNPQIFDERASVRVVKDKDGSFLLIAGRTPDNRLAIGTIEFSHGHARLEPCDGDVKIYPLTKTGQYVAAYQITVPEHDVQRSIVFLREGDKIQFARHGLDIVIERSTTGLVEVESSAPQPQPPETLADELFADLVPASKPDQKLLRDPIDENEDASASLNHDASAQLEPKLSKQSPGTQDHVYSTAQSNSNMVHETPRTDRQPLLAMEPKLGLSRQTDQASLVIERVEIDENLEPQASPVETMKDRKRKSHQPTIQRDDDEKRANFEEGADGPPPAKRAKRAKTGQRGLPSVEAEVANTKIGAVDTDAGASESPKPEPVRRQKERKIKSRVRVREDSPATMTKITAPVQAVKKTYSKTAKTSKSPEAKATDKSDQSDKPGYRGRPPHVLSSGSTKILDIAANRNFLQKQGAILAEVVTHNPDIPVIVCVSDDEELKSTAKILKALLFDKILVSDGWVTDSKKAGYLLDPKEYTVPGLERASERNHVFDGLHFFFTQAAMNHYKSAGMADIRSIIESAGGECNMKRAFTIRDVEDEGGGGVSSFDEDRSVIIGMADKDPTASSVVAKDISVWKKEFIARSIMEGDRQYDDRALLLNPVKGKENRTVKAANRKGRR